MAAPKALARYAPFVVTAHFSGTGTVDKPVFVAPMPCKLLKVIETHSTAGSASSTGMPQKLTAGTAPDSGTDLLSTAFALDSTVNTPVDKVAADFVSDAVVSFLEGEALSVNYVGTVSGYVGVFTFVFLPTGLPSDY